jgi:hypothetical protein
MRRLRCTPILPALAVVLAAIIATGAAPARAALWLDFRPASAAPGTTVYGRTGDQGALTASPGARLPLVLIPARQVDRLPRTVPTAAAFGTLPGAVPVGRLQVDQQGNGTITFPAPRVAPGRYVAVLWCPACAGQSLGANVLSTGELTLTVGQLPLTGPALASQVLAALALLLSGGALLSTSGRESQADPHATPAMPVIVRDYLE